MQNDTLLNWRLGLKSNKNWKKVGKAEAARRLGINPHTYADYEDGKRALPKNIHLLTFAVSHGVSAE